MHQPRTNRILIVDDNGDVSRSIMYWLTIEGFESRIAANADEALAIAADFQPQVILLDIGLPGQDGYSLARVLRKLPELQNALLVAMTGYGSDEDRKRSREAGIDHHLVKPLDHAKFLKLLEERGA